MKTKQEQIAEMAFIGCVRNPQAHTAEECAKCDFKQGQCNAYRHAEELYKAGYRKTFTRDLASDMQNAFKEGYEKGCETCEQAWDNGYNDGFEDGKEQAYKDCYDITRKETAKEILSRIKLYATGSKTDLIVLIDEIAKANGVEVNE